MRSLALLVAFAVLAFFCGLTATLGVACFASFLAAASYAVMPTFAKS